MTDPVLIELERLIRTDPARRGLIATESEFGPLLPGHLSHAARELTDNATSVGIVTGFFIPSADPPAAETDGPLGAVLLAQTLRQLNIDATIMTDDLSRNVIHMAARHVSFAGDLVHVHQNTGSSVLDQNSLSKKISHFISIERVGPNHTSQSIRALHPQSPEVWSEFEAAVHPDEQNRSFNMRGDCIDEWTAPLHRLFKEAVTSVPAIKTIGIGDGGNEIGMGSIPWTELVRRLPEPHGGKIACRIPCDWTILAGVSNWGGYALAAAVAHLRGRVDILEPWTSAQQFEWLEAIVRDGPAVDGVTRLAQPTVDGLPFATYIQPWDAMRQLLGLKR